MPVQVGWNREMNTRPFLQDAERVFLCYRKGFYIFPQHKKPSAGGENNKIKGDEEDESNIERWFM